MSVPTNLIPSPITGLPEYMGSSTLGYLPYVLEGRSYKVQFANIAAVGAVPSTRVIAAGTGLAGGGDLSENRVISIAAGGVGFDQLALSGVVAGTYGSGSAIPVLTIDSKGRITSATTAVLDVTGFVPTSRTITAGDGLTGGGSLTNNITLAANFSATTPSALGIASAGTSVAVSRGDHVHPAVDLSDTSQTQGALPLGRGGTGDALSPVAGAVVYSTGTKFALTNPGIAGQVLVSNGTDEPEWQTIEGAGTVTSVNLTAGTGISVSGGPITSSGSINVVNTAPDQIVSLTGAGTTVVTGTYPNFTITSNDSAAGTVTSVAASGGTTGLTFSGSPITTSGTLTLGGTLAVANGGTGATTASGARSNLGAAASGANSDITSLSGITGAISTVDSILFDTAAGVTVGAGQMAWNAADGTLDIGMGYDTVTQQVGLEQYYRIKASAAITDGQCVMYTGAVGASGVLTGAPATGVTDPQYILGVATMDIANNGFGYITSFGLVRAIDTTGSSVGETWADGDVLYYNPAYTGGLTKVPPTAPLPKVVVATVVNAAGGGAGSLFIRVQGGPDLHNLSDVYAPSPISNGQILIGDGPQGRWEAATLTAGTNVSITNAAGAITINATDQYAGTVTSVAASGGTTGLTFTGSPITTSGTLTLGGTLAVANGGTGATTLSANGILLGNGTSAISATAVGATGQVLVGNTGGAPSWAALSGIGVTSFSGGTTGFTPSTGTTGAITLAGTLNVANGGTGATSLTSGYLVKGNGTSAVSASVVYDDGTNVGIGTTSPGAKIAVAASNTAVASRGTAYLYSTNSMAANLGGQLSFGGSYTGTSETVFGSVAGRKENGTDSDISGYLQFSTTNASLGNVERMRIDSNGNVGIGTSSPGVQLDVAGSITARSGTVTADLYTNYGTNLTLNSGGSLPMLFQINASEKMRIDSSGNVLIGRTSSSGLGQLQSTIGADLATDSGNVHLARGGGNVAIGTASPISGGLLTVGSGSGSSTAVQYLNAGSGGSALLSRISGSNTWFMGDTVAALGSGSGLINFVYGANPFIVYTNSAERMRVDGSGNVLVGTTSAGGKLTAHSTTSFPAIYCQGASDARQSVTTQASGTSYFDYFIYNGTNVGSITSTGTITSYNVSSDYRLKNIYGPITNSGAYIDALNPVQGSWKADGSRFIGLLAHEVQEVSETPVATGEKDGEKMQSMDYSAPELIANLIAEVKSLRARVAQLEGN